MHSFVIATEAEQSLLFVGALISTEVEKSVVNTFLVLVRICCFGFSLS